MGYRYRLGKITKKERDKYITSDYKEVIKLTNIHKEEDYSLHTLPEHHELLIIDFPKKFNAVFIKPFFEKFNLNDMNGHEFNIMTKEGLKSLIDHYHNEITSNLKRELKQIEDEPRSAEFLIRQKIEKWNFKIQNKLITPYILKNDDQHILDLQDGQIAVDGCLEYQIFNLVFIYNTFDWENNFLILNGW